MSSSILQPGITLPLGHRILRFPLIRIVLALIAFMLPFLLIQAGSSKLFDDKLFIKLGQLTGALIGYLCYAMYVRKIEQRAVTELSLRGLTKEFGVGFLLGSLMVCVTVGIIALMGGFQITATSSWTVILIPLLMHLTIGLVEEILLRGVFFRIVQQSLGSWLALLASAVLFGAMHLVNDNITVLGFASITAAGLWLASAFMLTGRLWMCVAMHAAWNFFQGGIFSVAVSGHPVRNGLWISKINGPDWMTGGAFGIEGSAIAFTIVVVVTVGLLYQAARDGRIVQPFWKRIDRNF
ncbi:type II CAAX endopeptidase family protein [Undibacterium sp. 5I1]|uniref:CPBP family intramembrane glutamic endopeptidase n=1 Tax=unclassified Undibacterium TaxID=2630295 RepID=UPI002AB5D07B|nr:MULTISPECIES: type II CAAX endopeptidase family protein [unclassified Undibacterium]MDY7537721.1 type II CAAX endopeptidase family protein [Undibacterium sp. 5I1]MEB0230213.1 type II CAAX endopeptidase family protein [Undibacterium sp. 10I3]MEB0256458.1 type II CAAX endopeptidase family protein [Undibacterium sp. 5I1]